MPLIATPVLNLYFSSLVIIICLIGIQSLIVVPLLHYWSKYVTNGLEDETVVWSWSHPRFYKHFAIAALYPLIWGLYLTALKYSRLGTELDYNLLYERLPVDWLPIIVVFLTFYSIWVRLLLWSLLNVKKLLMA